MISHPKPLDYLALLALSFMWGSSFLAIEKSLISFGPLAIAAGRITIAALLLNGLVLIRGLKLPTSRAVWGRLLVIAVLSSVLPFILISWGQQSITSSLAAIIVALVPLNTMLMAHLMLHDERLTPRRMAGLVAGFSGILLLFAGGAEPGESSMLGMIAVFVATMGYAFSSIKMRALSGHSPLVLSAAMMLISFAIIVPLALLIDPPNVAAASRESLLGVAYLGIFSTALGLILLVWIIFRAGAVFFSMSNFLMPLFGVTLGIAFLDEALSVEAIGAFILIMAGVALTTPRRMKVAGEGGAAEG
ncbi:MAG: EamA family transporter [Sphingomonadales bacterium]